VISDQWATLKRQFFLVLVVLFLNLMLIARGLPVNESIKVILLIASQTYIGGTIWRKLLKKHDLNIIELLVAGFALGSVLFTIIDQFLIITGMKLNDFLTPTLLTLVAFFINQKREQSYEISFTSKEEYKALLITCICVFAGFGELTHGSLIAILVLITALSLLTNFKMSEMKISTASLASMGFAILAFFLFKPPILYGSWFLRPLFTKTDDAVFSESVAYSISNFGPFNYAAASGIELRYHWFSLAWSGLVDRSASVSPFGMTLHVVPVISFFSIAMLLISVARRIGLDSRYQYFAPIILSFSMSAPKSFYFYYVVNTSNLLTFAWVLLFFLIYVLDSNKMIKLGTPLLALMAGVVFLSKIPYLFALLSGVSVSSVYVFITSKEERKAKVVQLTTVILAVIFVFALFLIPHSWENRSYVLDWNLLNIPQGNQFRLLIAIVLIMLLVISRFPIYLTINRKDPQNVFKLFIYGASISGLIRFVVSGSTSEEYFLNNALIFGSIGIAWTLQEMTSSKSHFRFWEYMGLGVSSGLLSYSIITFLNSSTYNGQWKLSHIQILIPLVVAIATCGFIVLIRKKRVKSKLFGPAAFLFISCLVGSNVGTFLTQALKIPTYAAQGSIATEVDLSSLRWLRANTSPSDIVATNRYLCSESLLCKFDESSFLISAVANRQVLIEGPRFVAGGRPYPDWIIDRISLSQSFAESPTDESYRRLREFGVSWFFLDTRFVNHEATNQPSLWGNWASLEYQNSYVQIWKLNTSLLVN
jgi:hypothetical protein